MVEAKMVQMQGRYWKSKDTVIRAVVTLKRAA